MNLCTEEHLKEFDSLPFSQKFMLTDRKKPIYPCEFYWSGESDENGIVTDTKPFPGNVPITEIFK